jgi:hypothetical protein
MSQPKPIQTNIQDKNGKTHLCFSWWNLPSWTDVNSLVPTFGASQLDHNLTQLHNGSSSRPTRDCKLNLKDNSQFQEVKHCQSKSHKCFTCRVIYSHKLNRFNRAVECLKDSHLSGTQLSTSNCTIVRLEVQEPTKLYTRTAQNVEPQLMPGTQHWILSLWSYPGYLMSKLWISKQEKGRDSKEIFVLNCRHNHFNWQHLNNTSIRFKEICHKL